jgi:hypothetical protein
MKTNLVRQMQSYVAETCIGASALRNSGGKGLLKRSRDFFKKLDLDRIPRRQEPFEKWLNIKTRELCRKFPRRAQKFGTTRKALNLFLRSAAYNVLLNRKYSLEDLLPLLEVPLDSYAAKHLQANDSSLPRAWSRLKRISPTEYAKYQKSASNLAQKWGICRADLDVYFYRNEVPAV